MFTTLAVIGGLLVGLIGLLALIVSLSARPAPSRGSVPAGNADWVAATGRRHPDAWTAPVASTSEFPAVR
ncbi:hypothetical protein [Geodermatophilus ruber]|uniref:Uncharacterized protein n=1 Tax=Geodermatophilus ruber TaxID=504800 RepID=A0A1I3Z2G1_9ACTN|nr:hypothetical protein [Geodermatophilus ruber]SFK37696.1 hypothetical protein SAMN04488085_101293 [Geodermatophilus ruber]